MNASAKYITVILQLLYTAILSRILTPEDYGIVAIVNVFIIFFQLFADMGFGTGVIQNKQLTKDEINDVFSICIYIGILLMILFSAFSFPLSWFYNKSILVPLGIELAFSLMFNAFNMIPNAIMLREKRFSSIAIRTICVSVFSFTLTIYFALRGFGVYALAANSVILAFGVFLWNEISTKLKFRFIPQIESIKKIWGYSLYQFASQALNYFNRNLDNLLIGKFYSPADLGQYNKAYTLMQYPISYLPGVITPVLHPILSEHQNDKEYIYQKYMRLLKLLSLLGCFAAAFFWFAGHEIVIIAFGSQWVEAVPPFRILGISVWAQILTNTMAPIYQSVGNTKLMFKSTIVTTLLIVSAIVLGFMGGSVISIAITVSVGYMLNFFVTFFVLSKICFEKSFISFLKQFLPELIIFGSLMVCANFCRLNFESVIVSFIIKLLVFLTVYVFMLVATKQYYVFTDLLNRKQKN